MSQSRLDALQAESKQQENDARLSSLEGEKQRELAINQASQLVGEAKARLDSPQPARELVQIVEQQQAKVEEVVARYLDTVDQEAEAKKTYDQKRAAFLHTENQLRRLKTQIATENRTLDSFLVQASPDESSVLYVLRNQRPDWTQDIAKVLREDILMRTDLSPVIGAIQDSVYGLQVDLDLLDTPLVADELAMQREIEATREELKRLASRVEQHETLLAQNNEERQRAEGLVAQRSAQVAMAKAAQASAEQQLKTARFEVQRSRDAARDLAQQEYANAAASLEGKRTAIPS